MLARWAVGLALMATVVGCGGGSVPTIAVSQAPGTTATAALPTAAVTQGATSTPVPPGGATIDSKGVAAALNALQALDSWTFQVKTFAQVLGDAVETDVTGTERSKPQTAVDATHHGPTGDFRYIRIGDDIWADLGQSTFFHYGAADSANLISQYEPFYVATLVADADGSSTDYDAVGEETVNGVVSTHYRETEEDRASAAQFVGLTADQWAGDVWIAQDGGYLVRFIWGPQTLETASPIMGFNYDTTAVNCACPINPPTNVASP